jgi:hypothetical protein
MNPIKILSYSLKHLISTFKCLYQDVLTVADRWGSLYVNFHKSVTKIENECNIKERKQNDINRIGGFSP